MFVLSCGRIDCVAFLARGLMAADGGARCRRRSDWDDSSVGLLTPGSLGSIFNARCDRSDDPAIKSDGDGEHPERVRMFRLKFVSWTCGSVGLANDCGFPSRGVWKGMRAWVLERDGMSVAVGPVS